MSFVCWSLFVKHWRMHCRAKMSPCWDMSTEMSAHDRHSEMSLNVISRPSSINISIENLEPVSRSCLYDRTNS